MQAILMAHRMPSRHREATSGSSQSCSPTLNAASKGVHANYNTCTRIWCEFLKTGYFTIFDFPPFNIWLKYIWKVSEFSQTLNMGLTCSRCVALKNGAWAWLTASIRALAVFAICSISMLYSRRRCFSLATPGKRESQIFSVSFFSCSSCVAYSSQWSAIFLLLRQRYVLTLLGRLRRDWELFALLYCNLFACNLIIYGRQILFR